MTNDNYGAADPAVYSSLIKNNLLLLLSDLHWEVRRKVWGLEPPARIASSALVHLDLAVRARNGGRVATERARDLRRGAGSARNWRDGAPGAAPPLQELMPGCDVCVGFEPRLPRVLLRRVLLESLVMLETRMPRMLVLLPLVLLPLVVPLVLPPPL